LAWRKGFVLKERVTKMEEGITWRDLWKRKYRERAKKIKGKSSLKIGAGWRRITLTRSDPTTMSTERP